MLAVVEEEGGGGKQRHQQPGNDQGGQQQAERQGHRRALWRGLRPVCHSQAACLSTPLRHRYNDRKPVSTRKVAWHFPPSRRSSATRRWFASSASPPVATTSCWPSWRATTRRGRDRKSTRLNSSHVRISYAVFCLKKKKKKKKTPLQ